MFGPPKSAAGRRTVAVPNAIRDDLRLHLRNYVGDAPEALIFTGAKGAVLRRSGFQTQSRWRESVALVGLPGFHFHDLRHTGNTLAADTGAKLTDLMVCAGHSSQKAQLIYQHSTLEHQRRLAADIDAHARDRAGGKQSGGDARHA